MTPRWRFADLALLLLVLAVAGGARAWYLWECADLGWNGGPLQVQGDTVQPRPSGADKKPRGRDLPTEVDVLAHHWHDDRVFACRAPLAAKDEATAHVAPGYYWVVFLADSWLDTPDQADQVMRWFQAGLGTLTAALYFLFARRAFHSRSVAVLAGLFCALHPFWIINTAEVNDGVLVTFLVAACLTLGTRASQMGGPMTSLVFGLSLAGVAIVRAALLPFVVVVLLWFLWCCRTMPRGWFCALLAVLGFGNGLAPWTVRNFQTFDEIVPVADSAFLHLWIGNNPDATGGPMEGQLPRSEKRRHELRQEANQARRYNMLSADVADAVAADPGAAVTCRLRAALFFFCGEKGVYERHFSTTRSMDQGHAPAWVIENREAILGGTFLGMVAVGVLGWRWSFNWRQQARLATLVLLWVPLPYILSHGDSLSGQRLPLDGVLLTLTAFALGYWLPGNAELRTGHE